MFELLEAVADKISRIDLYCGYYDLNEIVCFLATAFRTFQTLRLFHCQIQISFSLEKPFLQKREVCAGEMPGVVRVHHRPKY
jgi:hypothetical protein